MNNKTILLRCLQINKSYKDGNICIEVLRNINFSICIGEMIAIIGSSGSGKSTLLHLLGGLDTPTSGEIFFKEYCFSKISKNTQSKIRNHYLGFIYQFHYLLPDFTTLENVAMPLMISGIKYKFAKNSALDILKIVGLEKRCDHYSSELSGGERQRVAIARALVNRPLLVLADEPTGNLDYINSNKIFDLFNTINICYGTSFLIVTHNLQLAKRLNKQIEICDGILQTST